MGLSGCILRSMRLATFLAAALLLESATMAAETAYTALRTVGKQRGAQTLEQVVEVAGAAELQSLRFGRSSSASLRRAAGSASSTCSAAASSAKGRPPHRASPWCADEFNQLNLDSEGVFTVANQEMQKARIPFDRIDYVLRSGSGGSPVWRVELFDGNTGRVATMEIAADTGDCARSQLPQRWRPIVREQDVASDREYLSERPRLGNATWRSMMRARGMGGTRDLESRSGISATSFIGSESASKGVPRSSRISSPAAAGAIRSVTTTRANADATSVRPNGIPMKANRRCPATASFRTGESR
jgi:hypothetical protein